MNHDAGSGTTPAVVKSRKSATHVLTSACEAGMVACGASLVLSVVVFPLVKGLWETGQWQPITAGYVVVIAS